MKFLCPGPRGPHPAHQPLSQTLLRRGAQAYLMEGKPSASAPPRPAEPAHASQIAVSQPQSQGSKLCVHV